MTNQVGIFWELLSSDLLQWSAQVDEKVSQATNTLASEVGIQVDATLHISTDSELDFCQPGRKQSCPSNGGTSGSRKAWGLHDRWHGVKSEILWGVDGWWLELLELWSLLMCSKILPFAWFDMTMMEPRHYGFGTWTNSACSRGQRKQSHSVESKCQVAWCDPNASSDQVDSWSKLKSQ